MTKFWPYHKVTAVSVADDVKGRQVPLLETEPVARDNQSP